MDKSQKELSKINKIMRINEIIFKVAITIHIISTLFTLFNK